MTVHRDTPELKPASNTRTLPVRADVERTAFYFQSEGQPLFGWLHRHKGMSASHGIVICPPVGHEQVHSHRALRHLADVLAGHGFEVLRFDYHGTGDSDGSEQDAHRCQVWQANVRDAAAWLRDQGGCQKISLLGLRLGASLAMIHAAEHEVENLVLWSPVVKGRRYMRELNAISRSARQPKEPGTSALEAAGFVYTEEVVQELGAIDLLTVTPRCRNALIVRSVNEPDDSPLFKHLTAKGLNTEHFALPGYEDMMAEPQDTQVPCEALGTITNWFLSRDDHQEHTANREFASMSSVAGIEGQLQERIHRISASPDLFGIATEPQSQSTHLPWLVMLNSGAAHRIGPGRLHVRLARHLAALGYPCLRVDITGLGDSVTDRPESENDTYAATAFRDVAIICDYLQTITPNRRIVLMGLCSGAYAAFQSAAQLPHPALVESILINPLTFFWKDGMSLKDSPTERFQAWHYYQKAIFNADSWRLLLSGKTNMGIKGSLQRFLKRMAPRGAKNAKLEDSQESTQSIGSYSHPEKEDLTADLNRVVAASRTLAMFVSESDPGHFLLMCQARRKARQMIRTGTLQCFFIKDADHTFSSESWRQSLTQSLSEYLQTRFSRSVITALAPDADWHSSPTSLATKPL